MEDRLCACGCGELVLSRNSRARYASKACNRRHYYTNNREKEREYACSWYAANREKELERMRRWYAANREKVCEKAREYRITNREKILKRKSEKERRLRLAAHAALGGKCVGCGTTNERILTIDHPNGDGAIERRAGITRVKLYKKVLEDPTRYQLMCRNCNWEKAIENGEVGRKKIQPSRLPTVNLNEERKAS